MSVNVIERATLTYAPYPEGQTLGHYLKGHGAVSGVELLPLFAFNLSPRIRRWCVRDANRLDGRSAARSLVPFYVRDAAVLLGPDVHQDNHCTSGKFVYLI